MDRRRFLAVSGAGVALVAAGGVWRVTRLPESAIAPWSIDPKPLPDVRLDALRYAILAPNPHNRQPWLIRLTGNDEALLSCDLDKRLPETDPFDRQITIGFGTFVELARIAAAQRGVRLDVTAFPDGLPGERLDARPVAHLRFVVDSTVRPDPLFSEITRRRTNRLAYNEAAPSPKMLAAVTGGHADASSDPKFLNALRQLTAAAITREMMTHRTHMESVKLMRIGAAEVDANPDGLMLTGPLIEATSIVGMTTRDALADPSSQSFKIGLADLQKTYASIPAAIWIETQGNSRIEQLDAGYRYARVTLAATANGLAMHPMSQSLQEYPEMKSHFEGVHALLAAKPGGRIQMLARIGMADDVPPTARHPLEAHIRT